MEYSIGALADRIRAVMNEEKLTAIQLAELSGVSVHTLGKVLRMETKEPSIGLIIDVANALNVSADWLLGLSEYRNSIEEIELSHIKEFGSKDNLAVDVYRKFEECTSQYKSFYAECFGVNEIANNEFQPPMCEIIHEHIIGTLFSYMSFLKDISSCNTEESFKNCVLSINNKICGSPVITNQLIEEAYRLYTERNPASSQFARVAAFGGGTKDVPPPKVSEEEIERLVEEAEQEEILAEIEAEKRQKGK